MHKIFAMRFPPAEEHPLQHISSLIDHIAFLGSCNIRWCCVQKYTVRCVFRKNKGFGFAGLILVEKCVACAWNTKPSMVETHVFSKRANTSADVFVSTQGRAFLTPHKLKMSFSLSWWTRAMLSKYTDISQLISSWPYFIFSFKRLPLWVASVRTFVRSAALGVTSRSDGYFDQGYSDFLFQKSHVGHQSMVDFAYPVDSFSERPRFSFLRARTERLASADEIWDDIVCHYFDSA